MSTANSPSILAPAIEALAAELPAGKQRREMKQLAAALRDGTAGDDLASNHRTQRWLPVLAHLGATPSSTARLSDWMRQASRESEIRSRKSRVLLYPIVILGFAALVFFALGQIVVTPFIKMYDEFGLSLPAPTEFLFYWVTLWNTYPLQFLTGAIVLGLAVYAFARFWIKHSLSNRLLGYVAAGSTANVAAMASLTGSLADLLADGVPLASALDLAGQSCGNQYYERVAMSLAEHHRRGSVTFAHTVLAKSLPRNVIDALQPPDGSAPRVALLRELSTLYAERTAERTQSSAEILSVLSVFIVGLIVAFIIIALFMPLSSLISGLA